MIGILQHLKLHGESSDDEIAVATGISKAFVLVYLSELAAKNEVVLCNSVRFEEGNRFEGIRCRLSGHIPKTTPGRKSKAKFKL